MPMELFDLDQAKLHLKVKHDEADDDIEMKLSMAHGIIEDYIQRNDPDWAAEVEAWDDETAPAQVKAAVLFQLEELWRFRGGHPEGQIPKREHGFLHPHVVALLHRTRDPVVR